MTRARWTVYLKESPKGWEWSRNSRHGQWGFYKTAGLAKGAAKRSIPQVAGGRTNSDDFHFVVLNEWEEDRKNV